LPTEFELPHELRSCFRDVSTGARGNYEEGSRARPHRTTRQLIPEERDPHKLSDKDNLPVLCFRCGQSAMPTESKHPEPVHMSGRPVRARGRSSGSWRTILSCDYCSLHWHLDCLDPPLTVLPPNNRKWMCPNHIDQVLPRRRVLRNITQTTDIANPGERNNGNIDIIPSEDPQTSLVPVEEVFISNQRYRLPERVVMLDFWSKIKQPQRPTDRQPPSGADLLNAAEILSSMRSTARVRSESSASQPDDDFRIGCKPAASPSLDHRRRSSTPPNPNIRFSSSPLTSVSPKPMPVPLPKPTSPLKIRIPGASQRAAAAAAQMNGRSRRTRRRQSSPG